jgi:hypothetical protein
VKPGDVVVCVDPESIAVLEEGGIYEVTATYDLDWGVAMVDVTNEAERQDPWLVGAYASRFHVVGSVR